jgi:16S rRNA (guanine1207-N2)-methyltransferase
VINRHLGGDSLHSWLVERDWVVERVASQKGYRVLRVTRKTD